MFLTSLFSSFCKDQKLQLVTMLLLFSISLFSQEQRFKQNTDLLLVHFDSKTDVDDVHTMAALATLLNHSSYIDLNYHTVAGAYGNQEGLYVPSNEVFKMAFNNNWSDAHKNKAKALNQTSKKALKTLKKGGHVWIADAGQSDFSAQLVTILNNKGYDKIHIVQHSDWNESVTTPSLLQFAKEKTDYHKIPDGNVIGNGTPGFRSVQPVYWKRNITDDNLVNIWEMAIKIANRYNGKEGRYLNEAIANGGLDFSDLSEVCYILNLEELTDANAFFDYFKN